MIHFSLWKSACEEVYQVVIDIEAYEYLPVQEHHRLWSFFRRRHKTSFKDVFGGREHSLDKYGFCYQNQMHALIKSPSKPSICVGLF